MVISRVKGQGIFAPPQPRLKCATDTEIWEYNLTRKLYQLFNITIIAKGNHRHPLMAAHWVGLESSRCKVNFSVRK